MNKLFLESNRLDDRINSRGTGILPVNHRQYRAIPNETIIDGKYDAKFS